MLYLNSILFVVFKLYLWNILNRIMVIIRVIIDNFKSVFKIIVMIELFLFL